MVFKKQHGFATIVVLAAALLVGTLALPAAPAESEAGFVKIFDGKDIKKGWIVQGMEKAGPKVENGVLKVGGWDYWAVITKKDYKDFILRFDVKFDKKGNSGILIHTAKKEVYKGAFEIQLADDGTKTSGPKVSGAIHGKVAPLKYANKPIGEWNSVEIKVQGVKIWVTINGEVVQDGVDLSKIAGLKHKFKKGGIAIQRNDYKKAAYFKNIRVKEL